MFNYSSFNSIFTFLYLIYGLKLLLFKIFTLTFTLHRLSRNIFYSDLRYFCFDELFLSILSRWPILRSLLCNCASHLVFTKIAKTRLQRTSYKKNSWKPFLSYIKRQLKSCLILSVLFK